MQNVQTEYNEAAQQTFVVCETDEMRKAAISLPLQLEALYEGFRWRNTSELLYCPG